MASVISVELRDPSFYYSRCSGRSPATSRQVSAARALRVALQGIRDNPRRMASLGFNSPPSRRRLRGGRPHCRGGRDPHGLVTTDSCRRARWHELAHQYPDHRRARRDCGIHRPFIGAIVFVLLQTSPWISWTGAVQPAHRRNFSDHRAVLARRPARLVGGGAPAYARVGAAVRLVAGRDKEGMKGRFHLTRSGCVHQEEKTMTSLPGSGMRVLALAAIFASSPNRRRQQWSDRPARHAGRPFAAGEPGRMRGAELAVKQRNGMVAGRRSRSSGLLGAKPDVRSTPPGSSWSRTRSISWSARFSAPRHRGENYSKSQRQRPSSTARPARRRPPG